LACGRCGAKRPPLDLNEGNEWQTKTSMRQARARLRTSIRDTAIGRAKREDFAVTKLTLVAAFALALPLATIGLTAHSQQSTGGGCNNCVTDPSDGDARLTGPSSGNGLTDPNCNGCLRPVQPQQAVACPNQGCALDCPNGGCLRPVQPQRRLACPTANCLLRPPHHKHRRLALLDPGGCSGCLRPPHHKHRRLALLDGGSCSGCLRPVRSQQRTTGVLGCCARVGRMSLEMAAVSGSWKERTGCRGMVRPSTNVFQQESRNQG
jgi:hypothetical protein